MERSSERIRATGAGSIETERLALDRERLRLERQKLAIEFRLKRRELAEQQGKNWKELLANPVTLAVVGGFVTLMITIVTNSLTARANRNAETLRAQIARDGTRQTLQGDLIKKFVESPKTETVRENLRFLINAGLLPDYAQGISKYLEDNPDAAPNTASARTETEGDSGARISDTSKIPFKFLCHLVVSKSDGSLRFATGFLVSKNIVITDSEMVQDTSNINVIDINVVPARNEESAPFGYSSIKKTKIVVDRNDPDLKLAALTLAKPFPELGYIELAALSDKELEQSVVNIAGYPTNRAFGTMWLWASRINVINRNNLMLDLSLEGGLIGSPIFRALADGRRIAIGVQSSKAATRITNDIIEQIMTLTAYP